jgi:hypothetical protein
MSLRQLLRQPRHSLTTAPLGRAPQRPFRARFPTWLFSLLLGFLMTTSLTACADDRIVFHSLSYDPAVDSPGIELLACRYGDTLGTATAQEIARGKKSLDTEFCTNGGGEMLIGDFLYVKWRDKATQQVHEDRVDLKSRLPSTKEMRGTTVYFLIDENKLYVYLVPYQDAEDKLNRRPENKAPNGPSGYEYLDVKTLYPDNDPPKVRGGRK